MSGFQNVHIRVNDAATGQPTPVRLRCVGADGRYYAPFGRLTEFATGIGEDVGGNVLIDGRAFAYIDGTCEIRLPVGTVHVEIHKGPEYVPLQEQVQLKQGKLALRFVLQRWADLRQQGWYSGDTHAFFMTPHAALLEAGGEDLAVVNVLAEHTLSNSFDPPVLNNILSFSGQRPALELPGHMVVVNTLNWHEWLGRLILLNCHRVVYPLTFGSPAGVDDWNLADWCEQCHRKGGLVVSPDFYIHQHYPAREALADLIMGYIDAIDVGHFCLSQFYSLHSWQELLSAGIRVPLTGGSGKSDNRAVLGSVRTYAHLKDGEEFTYKNWIEAIRAGRTFVTNGPLLSLTVDDHDPGDVLDLPATGQKVAIRVQARSLTSFEKLELLWNHQVIAEATPAQGGAITSASIDTEIAISEPGWFYARCSGSGCAHTSPIYVHVAGQARQPDGATVAELRQRLEKMLTNVREHGRFENEQQRERMAAVYLAAMEKLQAQLEQAR